ncbi:hypothetical protein [Helcococcus kunzii]|uniref:Twitching motility protein PilT n=1 Tax=Helcococcus kunzii ATCC 51366 TaxID=883114 RepID=H3NNI9_9FIRM|nr:hypothetical protein [Helcococcus kunzii]EHR33964.1 hypothetical protein HMPREF9709_00900 [Helcococcus kunzii ATCC 51366]MCT1795572.1 hypothetical protein [Helcococcus kunzii]MCT1989320.1 hypothetical protein [Helcococcus kunzii]QUY64815.1 hypothetical protein GUI37_04525 [Helcococcus kunzii]
MVKLILGKSGSGKTKYLIDNANEEKSRGNGNIVFVDTDDTHIFSLDYAIRLINANKFGINNIDSLYGFIAGIVSRDYDIEKMYLDGLYQIIDFDKENLSTLMEKLNKFSKDTDVDLFIGLDIEENELPEGLEAEVKVL